MIARILERLFASRTPSKEVPRSVGDKTERYLQRWRLFSSRWLGIYVHRFWLSDLEGLHWHPWAFIAIPLTVGYYEEHIGWGRNKWGVRCFGQTWRRALRPYFRRPTELHRVDVSDAQPGEVWTLFIRFKRVQPWGFIARSVEDDQRHLWGEDGNEAVVREARWEDQSAYCLRRQDERILHQMKATGVDRKDTRELFPHVFEKPEGTTW